MYVRKLRAGTNRRSGSEGNQQPARSPGKDAPFPSATTFARTLEITPMDPTIVLGAMTAGLGAMSAALTVLWRRFEKLANDCEEDRRKLWTEIANLKANND